MPQRNDPQGDAPSADGAGRPLEGLFFLWLDDNQRPWAAGRITRHMSYDRCMVTYFDMATLEPSWMGSMVIAGESVVMRRWLLFQTKEQLSTAVAIVNRGHALAAPE
jgi:hypothetical protein